MLRNIFQRIDKSHCVPPNGTPPEILRTARPGVRPPLRFAFIPAVKIEAGGTIRIMRCRKNKLFRDVVKGCRILCHRGVQGIEWLSHIQTIQPHLVRVDPLVPESAFARPWLLSQLAAKRIGSSTIFLFARQRINPEQSFARCDVIQLIFIESIGVDRAVFTDVVIEVLFDIPNVSAVTCELPFME